MRKKVKVVTAQIVNSPCASTLAVYDFVNLRSHLRHVGDGDTGDVVMTDDACDVAVITLNAFQNLANFI